MDETTVKNCLYCANCFAWRIDIFTGEPCEFLCSEAPYNENDEWTRLGMAGECLSFVEERNEKQ